jgi:hypothetical protein
VLAGGESALVQTARRIAAGNEPAVVAKEVSLLDLDDEVAPVSGLGQREKEELDAAVKDAMEKLDRLGKIRKERDEVLKDLKEKVCHASYGGMRTDSTDPK